VLEQLDLLFRLPSNFLVTTLARSAVTAHSILRVNSPYTSISIRLPLVFHGSDSESLRYPVCTMHPYVRGSRGYTSEGDLACKGCRGATSFVISHPPKLKRTRRWMRTAMVNSWRNTNVSAPEAEQGRSYQNPLTMPPFAGDLHHDASHCLGFSHGGLPAPASRKPGSANVQGFDSFYRMI